jgi:hypothetical protein
VVFMRKDREQPDRPAPIASYGLVECGLVEKPTQRVGHPAYRDESGVGWSLFGAGVNAFFNRDTHFDDARGDYFVGRGAAQYQKWLEEGILPR